MSYQRRRSSVTKGLVNQHIDRHKFFSAIIGLLLSASFYSPAGLAEPASGEAPDFTLASHRGPNMRLQEQRGDVIMLNFWASWCGPCRRENPNVKNLYDQYGGEQFEILSVSLDNNKARWEGAIKQDKMNWLHVSDLKKWQSVAASDYGVKSIPFTVLVDPEGKIIATKLRGPALANKLKELFG